MDRRDFLKKCTVAVGASGLCGSCLSGPSAGKPTGRAGKKPNVLFIFADDMSYNTIRSLGCDEIHTPNLDRLVRNGVTFTHAYNQGGWNGALCVASRAMLNTGRFLWNTHAKNSKNATELAEGRFWGPCMKRAGYDTYFSGKWHVNHADANKAFDHTLHIRPGMPRQTASGYNRPVDQTEYDAGGWYPWDTSKGGFWAGGKHWSEVLGDDAEQFLGQAAQSENPFFMYLAFNAPHDPRQSPKEYVDRYPLSGIDIPENFLPEYPYRGTIYDKMGDGSEMRDERLAPFPRTEYSVKVNRQEYYAIITHMDHQIGRILDALKETGQADNTYIFFTADHGLAVGHHGLIGKQNMFEHSVRAPLMVCGPNVPKGEKIDAPVYIQDVMPTTLELAGLPKPDHVQFKSLGSLISGEKSQNYDAIYGAYHTDYQRMVIVGDHKLILYPRTPDPASPSKKVKLLFNLKEDPLEMKDLSAKPSSLPLMKRLFARFQALQAETGDPLDLSAIYPELL